MLLLQSIIISLEAEVSDLAKIRNSENSLEPRLLDIPASVSNKGSTDLLMSFTL